MVKVFIQTDVKRATPVVESHQTVREVLEANGFDYANTQWALDGMMLVNGSLDKTFEQNGIAGDHCYLSAVARKNNA